MLPAPLTRFLAIALVSAALGCGDSAPPPPPPLEVVVASVAQKQVDVRSSWVGTITGFVNADIRAKVEGYLLKQVYRDGTAVKEGDLLFEIDPREYEAALDEAKGQLAKTQAILGRYENDVRRYTPLAAEGAVSQKELDDAIQGRAAARAQIAADRAALQNAELDLEWTHVLSPIDGLAGIAKVQVGDLVKPITFLTEVSQLDPIKVSFPISEVEYLHFARLPKRQQDAGDGATGGELELILADGEPYGAPGRFDVRGLDVDETTGTIEVQGVFPNPNSLLRPGQFAKVSRVIERIPDALVIPQRAVRDLQGISQVARVGEGNKIEFVNVELGPTTGSDYVIRKGLKLGDSVVIEGLQKVRDGLVVTPKPAGKPAPKPGAQPEAQPESTPGPSADAAAAGK